MADPTLEDRIKELAETLGAAFKALGVASRIYSGSNAYDATLLQSVRDGDYFIYDELGDHPGWMYRRNADNSDWEYVVSLVGPAGNDGLVPILELGNVTTGAAGSQAAVSVAQTEGNTYAISFTIPRGAQGTAGTFPGLTLNFSRSAQGTDPTAQLTGDSTAGYTLKLTLPKTMYIQSTAPSGATAGEVWIDTSTTA